MITEGEIQRSTFVTVLAWIFIIFTGFGTFISIMQNIMVSHMFSMPEMQQAMSQHGQMQNMPFFAKLLFQHVQLYMFMALLFTLSTFISAIGLLKRKNWARKIFITMISLGILLLLIGFGLQLAFNPIAQGVPQEQIPPEFAKMMNMMKIFMFIFTAAITCLFGWIIKKLTSENIKQEFINT